MGSGSACAALVSPSWLTHLEGTWCSHLRSTTCPTIEMDGNGNLGHRGRSRASRCLLSRPLGTSDTRRSFRVVCTSKSYSSKIFLHAYILVILVKWPNQFDLLNSCQSHIALLHLFLIAECSPLWHRGASRSLHASTVDPRLFTLVFWESDVRLVLAALSFQFRLTDRRLSFTRTPWVCIPRGSYPSALHGLRRTRWYVYNARAPSWFWLIGDTSASGQGSGISSSSWRSACECPHPILEWRSRNRPLLWVLFSGSSSPKSGEWWRMKYGTYWRCALDSSPCWYRFIIISTHLFLSNSIWYQVRSYLSYPSLY